MPSTSESFENGQSSGMLLDRTHVAIHNVGFMLA
jgi:hypothetical protein